MNFLALPELLALHDEVIGSTGGEPGVLYPAGLESSLARPFTAFGGKELFPSLFDKAAVLVHSLIQFHPFLDGNKRVALVAADVVLKLNGQHLTPSDEVQAFFWRIARGEVEIPEISRWIQAHSGPYSAP